MCDDRPPSRRQFLHSAAAVAALAAVPAGLRKPVPARLPLRSAARPVLPSGLAAYSNAMHVHSSFSEQEGSMAAQLSQAATNSVDVLWWTDHDQRMMGLNYRDVVHFTSLTAERGAAGQGGAWDWQEQRSGSLSSGSGGGIVTSPITPNDPAKHGSLAVQAQALSGTASCGFYANSQPAGWNYRDNLTGQSLSIDVLAEPGGGSGYLELAIVSSFHRAIAGRPSGTYSLSYRFTSGGQATRTAQGLLGVITVPVPAGTWATVTLDPAQDIAALWPDLDSRDFALWELSLNAVSTGALVSGYFGYLRFERTLNGGELFTQQQDMMAALASHFPTVTQSQGLEVSGWLPHLNWFGNAAIPDYTGLTSATYPAWLQKTAIPQIHAAGGLASYNHPYGPSAGPLLTTTQQDTLLAQTATALLGNGVYGADLIEVGYPVRGHCDLAHHVGLWDVFSRNAVFLTGNGTNDDHHGRNWAGLGNNWATGTWAASTAQKDLLGALAAGQAWCGSLSEFNVAAGAALDLTVDGTCPMGSVSLSGLSSRMLGITALGVPANGSVQVLQGAVDYAGTAQPTPSTAVIKSLTAAQLAAAGGQATVPADTTGESFARLAVLDAKGKTIAVSNPVWMLHNAPPKGIPAARKC